MASGPLVRGGGGDGSQEKHRWSGSNVYTRKAYKKPPSQKPPVSSQQTLTTTTDDGNSSLQQPPSPQQQQPPLLSRFHSAASDDASSLNNNNGDNRQHQHAASCDPVTPSNHTNHYHHSSSKLYNGHHPPIFQKLANGGHTHVTISLASRTRHEVQELRHKLTEELDQVHALMKKLEAREFQLASSTGHAPVATGYSHSQLSDNDAHHITATKRPHSQLSANDAHHITATKRPHSQLSANDSHHVTATKRPVTNSEVASAPPLRSQLSVSVTMTHVENNNMNEAMEKEKRTPKANQYYRNSEFVLGKEKFPPSDSHKKSKANGSKKHMMVEVDCGGPLVDKSFAQVFKSSEALLSKLMKHKHGWVFNTPVDVKGLGLHDYYSIIKRPMDLGTIKSRLNNNIYRSPREFAEDVRLTFQNAMTYNPKGQDVHIMAEQLSNIFEDHWPAVEAEHNVLSYPVAAKKAPQSLDMRRVLERSESTTNPTVPGSKPKPVSYMPHVGRTPAPKKPKAKDPNKRDMTFEEKQKLSYNLQSLPSEKLDNIVQIIKKRNSSLSQHDDEIEVDIESVDTETLWELDRFVVNYKKSLSKNKRKAELAVLARQESEHSVQERNLQNQVPAAVEVPKESKTAILKTMEEEKHAASSSPIRGERKGDEASRSSSSCSSSSDSGSSTSDSDSESSSYGSDAAHSPGT